MTAPADRPHGMTGDHIRVALDDTNAWDYDDPNGPEAQHDRAAGLPEPSRPHIGAPDLGLGWPDLPPAADRAFSGA